ncbi:MAG: dihydrodipicolinate reductase [Candidatus Nephrothrix sp. EaCA]|nr:MAG: dihydrodipicolinate reductase [Candidatus Nephrothrix sp. EaCA]
MLNTPIMKIGLIGFGKTGKAAAHVILLHKDFSLEWVLKRKLLSHRTASEFLGVESNDPAVIHAAQSTPVGRLLKEAPVDFIIDFSSEQTVYEYGEEAARRKVKIISAISHYPQSIVAYLKKLAESTVVFWSPNITLGVNFMMLASKYLQKIAPFADVELVEEHFKAKSGISGTALKIAEALGIKSEDIKHVRAGGIVGKHELIFGFPYQTVRLIHESIAREAFGNGALFAAGNLKDKVAGFYNFEDLLAPYFKID